MVKSRTLQCACAAVLLLAPARPFARQDPAPPRILLDQSPRAVEYQISRLTNAELVRVERKPGDPRYRPIYVALLTRKGLSRPVREEALTALETLDSATPTQILMNALKTLPGDDPATADKLLAILVSQPAGRIQTHHDLLVSAVMDSSSAPFVVRGAYAGLLAAEESARALWEIATKHGGHLLELLRAVPLLPPDERLRPSRDQLVTLISGSLNEASEPPIRAAGLTALASLRRDVATFSLLAREITSPPAGADAGTKAAAVTALLAFPDSARSSSDVEPLARAIVTMVRDTPAGRRTSPGIIDAVQLGEALTAGLPDSAKVAIRRDLRALSVRVVRIATQPEQMLFDLNWFVAEAGKPVQVSLVNPDAMPHNLVIIKPGTVNEVSTAAVAMPMPTDPDVKPFVPNSPAVLQATKLLNEGETAQLSFTAPAQAGEYVYLCTFPGHWVRMYGVMLVVESLDAWEAKPTIPLDPITGKPYASQRK